MLGTLEAIRCYTLDGPVKKINTVFTLKVLVT